MLTSVLSKASMVVRGAPEEISAHVNQHVGRHRLEIRQPQQQDACLSVNEFADLGLSSICYGSQVRVACPDLEDIYHFQVVLSGHCQWRFSDTRMVLQPGQALMMNPGEKIDLDYSADCQKLIVRIPEATLRNTCIDYLGRIPKEGLQFTRKVVDLKQSRSFLSCVEAVCYEANDGDSNFNGLSETYRELLVRKLMTTFENNALDFNNTAGSEDVTLKKVLLHIDDNIRENVSVDELAAIANLSVRRLYTLFSEGLSTTPRNYIKQRRLAAIHRELKFNAAIRNVTEAALDYSFTHLGRFSSEYKAMYGELPSETLKNRAC